MAIIPSFNLRMDLAQRAIVSYLKSDTALLAALGTPDKITESQFQGQEIGYPTIKVDMGVDSPIGNGIDRKKISRVSWSVQIFSESFSSAEANRLMGLVIDRLFQSQMLGLNENNIPTFRFTRVDLTSQSSALRMNNRLWKAEVFFESEVHPVDDDPRIPT